NAGGILGMFDMFSGGALGRMTIFALNIMPYISASIIIQLLTAVSPTLEALKKEGESGRKKLNQYTRLGTVLLAAVQSYGIAVAFIVFMERAQRRILVQYPKRQMGNKMFGGDASHLPLKINTSGVIPPIFASSLLLLPATVANFEANGQFGWISEITAYLAHGRPLYMALYVGLIVFFCFFYTAIVFNPEETADNLRKYGGFLPGIRPGENTADD